ncbi:hypothetical protein RHOSPDRAFT_34748 [Rhodotorula sp. JG-1b]|nr:hypothetical protein RHOSPDRAFT_34748 [Rhodotorula sp. JG-1b]
MLAVTLSRRSSDASTSSATPSLASSSGVSSSTWSSFGTTYDLLEPIQGPFPRDLVDSSQSPKKRSSSSRRSSAGPRPACTLQKNERLDSIFSFPRNHTKHDVCPRHGIVHDPALALPERDSREATDSDHSSSGSCSSSVRSSSSGRSLKCALSRIASHIKRT